MYEPDSYVVEGFNPGMPVINEPPIGLTDQEILVVIAYLQSLGGTPTVTLQTAHRYYTPEDAAPPADAALAEGTAPDAPPPAQGTAPGVPPAQGTAPGVPPAQGTAPGVPPAQGATPGAALAPAAHPRGLLLRPDTALRDMMRAANAGDTGMSRMVLAAAGVPPVGFVLAVRGESPASHRNERDASRARRDDREYRLYLTEEQRRPRGGIARRMQTDFQHGLLRVATRWKVTR